MRLHSQEPINVIYHPTKFRGHRHGESGDIRILVCQVISQDYVIKDDVTYRQKPIKVGYHPVKFGDPRHSDGRDMVVLVCQVISQDHQPHPRDQKVM